MSLERDLKVCSNNCLRFPGTRAQFTVSSGEPLRFGATIGGGLSWRLRFESVEPELRYTHWTAKRWMATSDEIDVLFGITFPVGRH
jgi:hypothetical protein